MLKSCGMKTGISRRRFLWSASALAATPLLSAQQAPPRPASPAINPEFRSTVGLVHGEDRRRNVYESLVSIEDQILPVLKTKKSVIIKPNNVSTVNQLAASHADGLRGMLDFLAPRFKGPVFIAESSAGRTFEGFDNFKYTALPAEYKSVDLKLIDLNEEGKYEIFPVLDADLHAVPVRLAARLLDSDAFVLCAALMKTHNVTVATLSVKNMALGAPLRSGSKETPRWNDKRHYHGGVRQTHFDIFMTAQKMKPFWNATVIDGFEGMEGNGPSNGQPVPSRVAIASTDFIAADRVGVELMGISPDWLGYLNFCSQAHIGQYDLSKIDIRGPKLEGLVKKYALHGDIERELQWMGPLNEIPPRLG
ncbi:MAG: DUF362 domain-containing protein [Acidobacteria bacterium]|nr:MAG: DUF362 domain-containing protein [Acidobacteriota bacterium]